MTMLLFMIFIVCLFIYYRLKEIVNILGDILGAINENLQTNTPTSFICDNCTKTGDECGCKNCNGKYNLDCQGFKIKVKTKTKTGTTPEPKENRISILDEFETRHANSSRVK